MCSSAFLPREINMEWHGGTVPLCSLSPCAPPFPLCFLACRGSTEGLSPCVLYLNLVILTFSSILLTSSTTIPPVIGLSAAAAETATANFRESSRGKFL